MNCAKLRLRMMSRVVYFRPLYRLVLFVTVLGLILFVGGKIYITSRINGISATHTSVLKESPRKSYKTIDSILYDKNSK